jgi:hypothetical protein
MNVRQTHLIDPAAPEGIYLVDTFKIPSAPRVEVEVAMRRNRMFLRTLDGFCGDLVLVRAQGDSFDIATVAAWESPAAMAAAKERVAEYYRQIGFDMPASIARWGVTFERTICTALPELP